MGRKKQPAAAVIRYSEAFKRQVLREVQAGQHSGPWAAQQAYGIRGTNTVARWLRAAGKTETLRKVVRVESTEERDQVKELKVAVKELKQALADAHMDLRLESAYLKLACAEAGVTDLAAFKKKHGGRA